MSTTKAKKGSKGGKGKADKAPTEAKSVKTTGEAKRPVSTKVEAAPKKAKPEKKLSALSAASQVLEETGEAMTCPELIAAMEAKGYWSSPAGKTPAATLSAAMHREIKVRGNDARFKRWNVPGKFVAASVASGDGAKPVGEKPPDAAAKKRAARKAKQAGQKAATEAKPAKQPKQSTGTKGQKEGATVETGPTAPTFPAIPDGAPGPENVAELFRL